MVEIADFSNYLTGCYLFAYFHLGIYYVFHFINPFLHLTILGYLNREVSTPKSWYGNHYPIHN